MTRWGGWLILVLLLATGGCDSQSQPAAPPPATGVVVDDGWGLATPGQIGDFTRVDIDPPAHPQPGVTVGYSHVVGDDAVIATMSVRPRVQSNVLLPGVNLAGGGVDAASSAEALTASIAQVRRFYPQAAVVSQGDAYLVQRGALQQGRQAVLEYRVPIDGQQRAMRLHVYSFCCQGGTWAYEYRFRYPATVDDEAAISTFLRESSWNITPQS